MRDGGDKPRKLLTFSSGGWVVLLAVLLSLVAAVIVLIPVWETGFRRAVGDGKYVGTYGFDLSNLTVSKDQLRAVGVSKDAIRALPAKLVETVSAAEVELMRKNERIRFLVAEDRIVGVTVGGQTRGYPVRVLAQHEVCNDVLGGVPIAVTYSPLCDSVVVFDRRIDGGEAGVEFGVSGLLINSNLVMFDRRSGAKGESLWSQLGLKAVAGPKAGTGLKLLPYEMTTWGQWKEAHPGGRALMGLRTLKKEYGREPYNTYWLSDDLRFPVSPLWTGSAAKKAKIVVVPTGDGKWRAELAEHIHEGAAAASAGTQRAAGAGTQKGDGVRIYTFLFAWYAFHGGGTEWGGIR